MSREEQKQLEVTFRLPAEGLPQLTQLLSALLDVVRPTEKSGAETGENTAFDRERFQALEGELPQTVAAEVSDMTGPEAAGGATFDLSDALQRVESSGIEIREIASPRSIRLRPVYPAGDPRCAAGEGGSAGNHQCGLLRWRGRVVPPVGTGCPPL